MPTPDLIATTDTAEIEALMARLAAGQLHDGDTHTLHRLLRTFLSLIHLLQRKNASLARLRRLLFGPRSEKRAAAKSKSEIASPEEPTTDEAETRGEPIPSAGTTPQPTSCSTSTPKRPGHGR